MTTLLTLNHNKMTNLQFITLVLTKNLSDKFIGTCGRYLPRSYVFELNHVIRNHVFTYLTYINCTDKKINVPVLLNLLNLRIINCLNLITDDRSSLTYMVQTELYEGMGRIDKLYNQTSSYTTLSTNFENDLNRFRGVKLPEMVNIMETLDYLHI